VRADSVAAEAARADLLQSASARGVADTWRGTCIRCVNCTASGNSREPVTGSGKATNQTATFISLDYILLRTCVHDAWPGRQIVRHRC
jgi:hypothetical protein